MTNETALTDTAYMHHQRSEKEGRTEIARSRLLDRDLAVQGDISGSTALQHFLSQTEPKKSFGLRNSFRNSNIKVLTPRETNNV